MKNKDKIKKAPEQEPEFLGDDIEVDDKEADGEFSENYARELALRTDDDGEIADSYEETEDELADDEPEDEGTLKERWTRMTAERKQAHEANKIDKDWADKEVLSEVEGPGYIRRSPIHSWFSTLMIMNLPIIGWIYLLVLALRRNGDQRKDFAKAYLVYKLVFFLAALLIILIVMYCSMGLLDQLLEYVNML